MTALPHAIPDSDADAVGATTLGLGQPAGRSPRALADFHGLPFVDLRAEQIQREAAESVPLHILTRTRSLPYRLEDGRLTVAVGDPDALQLIDELRVVSRHPIDLVVTAPADIEFELRRLARGQEVRARANAIGDEWVGTDDADAEIDLEADDGISDAPPIHLVNSIISHAAEEGASDVHFLPQHDSLVARVRIDGILHEVERIPARHATGILTRVKVLAKLDIAEHRVPQDGRFTIRAKSTGRLLDIRVAVLPTVEGEGAILRILDKTREAPTLTEIGLSNAMQMTLEEIIYRPTGAFLVTGPTGSGKSSTVYAALADMRRPEINVITFEDPVEYRLEDVYQLQVNQKAGLTFATGLRAILRSDPDVLMVGEIRDLETAKITLEAALTGHAVLSTLHSNDAPSAISRLTELGVEPFVIGSALNGVLAQRLVRKLCLECREAYQPSRADLEYLGFDAASIDDGITLYRRRECNRCLKGYRGRTGVYQLMLMDEELARVTGARAGYEELLRTATAAGMRSLWQDGLVKAAAGITTIEELSRVVRA
ncbi:MAG: type pilus assembly protein PilB [Gaiellaceae bacterium]|nr:type pilus assembly protein PilB [Gaiellaceae bacterium]